MHDGAITRRLDWRPRLSAYLAELAGQSFRPGRFDCALFVAGAIEVMTGHDFAAAYRGAYRSIEDGLSDLAEAGFSDHVAFVAAHLPEVHPAFAQAGDVAVVEENGAPALGLVQGEYVYVVLPSKGLGLLPRTALLRAFKV